MPADARPVSARRPTAAKPAANGVPFTFTIAQLQGVIDDAHRCATGYLAQLSDTHGGSRLPLPIGHGLVVLAIFRWNLGAVGHAQFVDLIETQCRALLNPDCDTAEARGHLGDLIGKDARNDPEPAGNRKAAPGAVAGEADPRSAAAPEQTGPARSAALNMGRAPHGAVGHHAAARRDIEAAIVQLRRALIAIDRADAQLPVDARTVADEYDALMTTGATHGHAVTLLAAKFERTPRHIERLIRLGKYLKTLNAGS